jgi:DNA-binding protein HU-beta
MNKAELVDILAKKTNSAKIDSETWLNAFIEIVSHEMKRNDIRLSGFGTFTTAKRSARNGVNPQTGKSIRIPARTVPKFRPGKELKEYVKK